MKNFEKQFHLSLMLLPPETQSVIAHLLKYYRNSYYSLCDDFLFSAGVLSFDIHNYLSDVKQYIPYVRVLGDIGPEMIYLSKSSLSKKQAEELLAKKMLSMLVDLLKSKGSIV